MSSASARQYRPFRPPVPPRPPASTAPSARQYRPVRNRSPLVRADEGGSRCKLGRTSMRSIVVCIAMLYVDDTCQAVRAFLASSCPISPLGVGPTS